MGRKVVKVSPELIAQCCVTDYHIAGDDKIVRVRDGVPADAVYLTSWYDGRCFVLLFEHHDWPDVKANEDYPVVLPRIETIKTSNSWTWLSDDRRIHYPI